MQTENSFRRPMGFITTGTLTLVYVNKGLATDFMLIWLKSWLISYMVAVPTMLGPVAQTFINGLRTIK